MEVGGRSSLRAKSKERGDVLSMFKRDDPSGDGEDSNRGSVHNNSQQSPAISEYLPPPPNMPAILLSYCVVGGGRCHPQGFNCNG
jgi:hypothetical protein